MALSKTMSGAELESGYAARPNHKLVVEPAPGRYTVEADGRRIVATEKAVLLREGNYPPVLYFPRADADMSALAKTAHATFCPFKAHASYYSIGDDRALQNAVWSYEDPFEEVAAIKDFLAFYPDKVRILRASDS